MKEEIEGCTLRDYGENVTCNFYIDGETIECIVPKLTFLENILNFWYGMPITIISTKTGICIKEREIKLNDTDKEIRMILDQL